eukprot:TRINITY_DN58936_c0_g1_i1.p1 TRINITY_DN58936_c0_g1~~TRINITY_DN58936_c0_g1_i1.p1  ORF type:complete len:553 (-),score=87.55 TRINITY_DN58936_c0_g1_i1:81-1625(-)
MDGQAFSSDWIIQEIERLDLQRKCSSNPDKPLEILLAENLVHLIVGGPVDAVSNPAVGAGADLEELADIATWIHKLQDSHERMVSLDATIGVLRKYVTGKVETRHVGVSIQAALPGRQRPTLYSVAAEILNDEETSEPLPGSVLQLLVACALLDFLTLSPGSGAGATAVRSLQLKPVPPQSDNALSSRFSRLTLHASFGPRLAAVALGTPVLHSLATPELEAEFFDKAREEFETINLHQVAEALSLAKPALRAARKCLCEAQRVRQATKSAPANADTSESILQQTLDALQAVLHTDLGVDDPAGYLHRLSAKYDDVKEATAEMASDLGFELYESAVSDILAVINESVGDRKGRPKIKSKVVLSVIEIPSCAPASFVVSPNRARVEFDETGPTSELEPEDMYLAAGASLAVDDHVRSSVFEWRWKDHLSVDNPNQNWRNLHDKIRGDVHEASAEHARGSLEEWSSCTKHWVHGSMADRRTRQVKLRPLWRMLASRAQLAPAWMRYYDEQQAPDDT